MEKIFRFIDKTSTLVGKWASFLVVILTLAIGYDITVRYLFAIPNFWAYDMTIMLYGSYAILGGRLLSLPQRPCAHGSVLRQIVTQRSGHHGCRLLPFFVLSPLYGSAVEMRRPCHLVP